MENTTTAAAPTVPVAGAVVVAVDGSRHAGTALAWAARQAAATRRQLVLVHVTEPVTSTYLDAVGVDHVALDRECFAHGSALVEDAATRVLEDHPELQVHRLVLRGDARGELLRLADTAAQLVLGSRGRGPLRSLLLGSVSAAVARHASCHVTVVRPGGTGGGGVLVGVDGSERSMAGVEAAYVQADLLALPLTVLHCFWDARTAYTGPVVADDDPDVEDVRALIAETVAGLCEKHPDVEVRTRLVRGLADQVLVAEAEGRDLVVLGYHRQGVLGEALFPSVVSTVLEHAHGPVMVVRSVTD